MYKIIKKLIFLLNNEKFIKCEIFHLKKILKFIIFRIWNLLLRKIYDFDFCTSRAQNSAIEFSK